MERFDVAVETVQKAGELLRQCQMDQTDVQQKTGHQDLVTRWDRKIEQLLRNEILTAFPQDSIVGEVWNGCSAVRSLEPFPGTPLLGRNIRQRNAAPGL